MAAFQLLACVGIVQSIVYLAGLSAFHAAAFNLDRLGPGLGSLDQSNVVEPAGETNAFPLPEEQPMDSAAVSSVSLSRINDNESLLHVLVDVHLDRPSLPSAESALPAGGLHLDPLPPAEIHLDPLLSADLPSTTDKPAVSVSDSFSIDDYIKASELLDRLQADQPQFDFQPIHDKLKGSPDSEEVKEMINLVRNLREKLTRYIRDTTRTLGQVSLLVFDPPISDANLANQPRWQRELNDAMERAKDIIDDFIDNLYDIKTQLQMVGMEVDQLGIPISEVVLKPAPRFRDDRKRQPVSPKPIQTLSEYADWMVDFVSNTIQTANELAVKSFPRFRMVRAADDAATLEVERERFTRSIDEYREFLDFLGETLEEVPDINPMDLKEPSRV